MDHTGVKDLSGNNPNICVQQRTLKLSKTFSGTGVSDWVFLKGRHPVYIKHSGTATVKMERSNDGGATVQDIKLPDGSTTAEYTAEATFDIDLGEKGGLVRFNCTAHTNNVTCEIGDNI